MPRMLREQALDQLQRHGIQTYSLDPQNAKQSDLTRDETYGRRNGSGDFITLPIGATVGRKIEIPTISIVEFCTEYNLGQDILRLLSNAGFSTIGGLIRANDLDQEEFGLKFGHVAEVKWALKAVLLSCPAIDEVQIPAGLYRPILIGGTGGDGGRGGKLGGDGGVGRAPEITLEDVRRFGHISGGIGGDGGAGGVWFENSSGFDKSPDNSKSSSMQKAGNEERTVSGGKGGCGGWGLWLGGDGGVGGAPVIPLEAVGQFKWIEGGHGGTGGASPEIGGKGGIGEAPRFPKPLAVIDHTTRLLVQTTNMKLKEGEEINTKLHEFNVYISKKLIDRLYDHGFQTMGGLFEIYDADLDGEPFKAGNKDTLRCALEEFLGKVNKNASIMSIS
ncbi:hypothetical protein K438DRAFT_1952881 [Mycena galopus ATCC 62051]|nr:hypothetical protein K438DRAFT_1952881 [Mycena galopus ATCC 62051]